MKKLIFIMVLGLLWSSCGNEEGITPPSKPDGATSELRTIAEAISIADKHFASRAEGARAITRSVKGVRVIGNASGRSASDTLIYAINYEDNAGFALVSAVPHGIDIIGYADEGSFDVEKIQPGSNIEYFLNVAKDYVSTQGLSVGSGTIIRPDDTFTRNYIIPPVLKVKWGERYPEGMYFSNYHAGCGQTAMAQMLSYLEVPTSLSLTYPGHDISIQPLNWAEIRKHSVSCGNSTFSINEHLASCQASEDVHKSLARLCRELGHRNGAIIDIGTGTDPDNILKTFKVLCPGKTTTIRKSISRPYETLWDDLYNKKGIALVDGYDSALALRHIWVCDGGDKKETTSLKYDGSTLVTNEIYYHYNWGNYGKNDGYFAAGVFDETKARSRYNYSQDTHYFVVYK